MFICRQGRGLDGREEQSVERIPGRSGINTLKLSALSFPASDEQGNMLIELLLGFALALLTIGILQQAVGLVLNGYRNSGNRAELQYSARVAQNWIQQDIRTARNFQVDADAAILMITGPDGEDIRIYASNNGNLYRVYKSKVPVAENISAIEFIKSGARLRTKITLHNQGGDYEIEFCCFSRVMQAQE